MADPGFLMHNYCADGDTEKAIALIKENPELIFKKNEDRHTALATAIKCYMKDTVKALFIEGAARSIFVKGYLEDSLGRDRREI